jgi:hypothetical protein
MNSKTISLIAAFGALSIFAGCATEPTSHVVSAPPPGSPTSTQQVLVTQQPQQVIVTQQPQQVVTTTAASGATTSFVVLQAPPAPQAPQAIPTQPSSRHVWIDGYWTWRNNRYEWMAGHWEVPPFSGAKWENPRVETESGAYRFYEGRWM